MVYELPIYIRLGFANLQEFKANYFKNLKPFELSYLGKKSFITANKLKPLIKEVEDNFEFAQHKIEFEADLPYNIEKQELFSGILPQEKFCTLQDKIITTPEKAIIYTGYFSTLSYANENIHQSNPDFFNILYKQNIQILDFEKLNFFLEYFPQAYNLTKLVRLQKLESLDTLREFRNICFDTQYSIQDILNVANEARQKRNEEKTKARIYQNQLIILESKLPVAFLERLGKLLKLCNHTLERTLRICLESSLDYMITQLDTIKNTLNELGDFFRIINHYKYIKINRKMIFFKCFLIFQDGVASIQPNNEEILSGFKDFLLDAVLEAKKIQSLELNEIGNSREQGFMRIIDEDNKTINKKIKKICKILNEL